MKNKKYLSSLIVITTFMLGYYGKKLVALLFPSLFSNIHSSLNYLLTYTFWIVFIFSGELFIHGFKIKKIFLSIGLDTGSKGKKLLKGLYLSFIFTLPMMIGYFYLTKGRISDNIFSLEYLIIIFLPPIMEELFFRGYLFGELFFTAKWKFFPAVLISSLLFSAGHLYQAQSISSIITVVLITFIGGAWYSWLYVSWEKSIYIPVFLHFFMNLWWIVFSVSNNVVGTLWVNFFRVAAIFIATYITIKKRSVKIKKNELI